ncbi:YrhB domain-containing protein [Kitasatospora sp. NPDC127111]|uniref:YrhB domain-containing protein n=1 Tax=Kitasatospora sp. NPDC127111 TaxID=3345363 RepID=UPI00362F7930
MIDYADAHRLAQDYVRNLSVSMDVELVLVDDAVTDEEWCWVFPYDSRAHLEKGDTRDALIGLGPLVVVRDTGAVHQLGSNVPPDEALALMRRSSLATEPAATGAPPPAPTPLGLTRAVTLDRSELASVVRHLGLPPPGLLSPLADLPTDGARPSGAGPDGMPRDPNDLLRGFRDLPEATLRNALLPLTVPDRVVEARAAVFDAAPTPCRLYASRRAGDVFTGLRPAFERDYELLAPYVEDDLARWVQSQLQFSAAAPIAPPEEELDAEQLAFLLTLVDAYKTRSFRAFTGRRPMPTPIALSPADVLEAQNDALLVADRRWLTRAVTELFALLVHPGGRTDVGLPLVTEGLAERELRRYTEAGHLTRVGTAAAPRYEPSLGFTVFAGTLFTWTSVLSLHDIQLTGWERGRATGQEELLLFIVTQQVLWTVLSDGLTRAPDDWSGVRFALRSLSLADASVLTDEFLRPLPLGPLPDEIYAPAATASSAPSSASSPAPSSAPSAASATTPAPPPPPPPPRSAPVWQPTHLVPEGGMEAWAEPDPALEPVVRIDAGVELQVVERAGDWARIVCSNGWSAWVDGRAMERLR